MTAKKADVTTAQVTELRRMANSKGVSRQQFQSGLSGVFPKALDAIKSGGRLVLEPLRPPQGGKIEFVDDVLVQQDIDWQMAISQVEVHPPEWHRHNARLVAASYPAMRGVVRVNLVLARIGMGVGYEEVLDWWASQPELKPAPPRHVFSLAQHRDVLRRTLGVDAEIVSPVECKLENIRSVCVLNIHSRLIDVRPVKNIYYADQWVAFLLD